MSAPDSSASAGIFGFLVFFALGLVLWLLMRSMSSKIQHIEYDKRDQELQSPDEAVGERGAAEGSTSSGSTSSGPTSSGPTGSGPRADGGPATPRPDGSPEA